MKKERNTWVDFLVLGLLLLVAFYLSRYEYLNPYLYVIGGTLSLIALFLMLKWLFSSDKDSKNKRNTTGQLNDEQSNKNG